VNISKGSKMMEDGDQGQDVNSPGAVSEEIDLNDEANDNKSISQGSDDSSVSAKMLSAAASAGKTIVKVTEDTIQKVAASADEVLRPHDDQSDEGAAGDDSSSPKKEENADQAKEEQEPVTAKVLHAASAAGKTVVDVAKRTGDAFHKVVESAMHKQKSTGEEKEKETSAHEPSDVEQTATEEQAPAEPVTTKVLHAATAAGKTVVDLSVSAAKYTGEVIHKVAASAGEVLHKEKPTTPTDGAEAENAEPTPTEGDGTAAAAPPPQPKAEEASQGIRMWSSVRRMSEKVLSTTSNTISKAAAAVQSPKESEAKADTETQETDAPAVTDPEASAEPERNRSGSMNQLWSSVKKTADSIADSASAAYKAAEPVAISTASKVSHGAQTVWSTTKEKVFPSKKADSEDSVDLKPEGSPADSKERAEEEKQQSTDQAVQESEVTVEVEASQAEPEIIATSAEPEIVSPSPQNDDQSTANEATQETGVESHEETHEAEETQGESNEENQKEES
jgi:hypothetical protein